MGIGFSHGGASWSYSGFSHFRQRLASAIGIELSSMRGYGGNVEWSTVADPIAPLLNHSDCDGELAPAVCSTVAPRLAELIVPWDCDDYDREMAIRLVNGMIECASKRVPLGFH